jgi:hypothetical protein
LQIVTKIAEVAVFNLSACAVKYQEAAAVSWLGWRLGNGLRGKLIIK